MASATSVASSSQGVASFGALGGGSHRYETGSHVNSNGFSLVAGLCRKNDFREGRLTSGVFLECGSGNYTTHNDFSHLGNVCGRGSIKYFGCGLLERFDFGRAGEGGFYVEGSERVGRTRLNFDSPDLGSEISYNSRSLYYGLHLGGGYGMKISEVIWMDVHCRYLWTHQNGDKLRLADGREAEYDDVNSHRVQMGAKLLYKVENLVDLHVSGYYEHGFDGRMGSKVQGVSLESPRLGGHSLQLETGATYSRNGFSVSLGVEGYVGNHRGLQGKLQVSYCL
jgi:outer membrane autotransporter protein